MLDGTICPKCGKEFFPYPEHAYKVGSKRYCSWTCLNHRNDGIQKKSLKIVEQYTLNGVFVREFESAAKAAEFVNGSTNRIRDACRGKCEKAYKFRWKYKE